MYGFTPEDIFLKVVNSKRKMHMSAEELREIFDHFPKDRLMTARFEDFYINKPYVSNKELGERIVRQQAGKDFYIPSSDEVEEYFSTHALLSKKCYQDLETFLIRHLKMDVGEAVCIVLELWDRTFEEEDTHDVIQWFGDLFEFDNEAQVNEVLPLLMAAMNGTNLLRNRGYAPAHVPSTADDVL